MHQHVLKDLRVHLTRIEEIEARQGHPWTEQRHPGLKVRGPTTYVCALTTSYVHVHEGRFQYNNALHF
jgi:hypothetical protein